MSKEVLVKNFESPVFKVPGDVDWTIVNDTDNIYNPLILTTKDLPINRELGDSDREFIYHALSRAGKNPLRKVLVLSNIIEMYFYGEKPENIASTLKIEKKIVDLALNHVKAVKSALRPFIEKGFDVPPKRYVLFSEFHTGLKTGNFALGNYLIVRVSSNGQRTRFFAPAFIEARGNAMYSHIGAEAMFTADEPSDKCELAGGVGKTVIIKITPKDFTKATMNSLVKMNFDHIKIDRRVGDRVKGKLFKAGKDFILVTYGELTLLDKLLNRESVRFYTYGVKLYGIKLGLTGGLSKYTVSYIPSFNEKVADIIVNGTIYRRFILQPLHPHSRIPLERSDKDFNPNAELIEVIPNFTERVMFHKPTLDNRIKNLTHDITGLGTFHNWDSNPTYWDTLPKRKAMSLFDKYSLFQLARIMLDENNREKLRTSRLVEEMNLTKGEISIRRNESPNGVNSTVAINSKEVGWMYVFNIPEKGYYGLMVALYPASSNTVKGVGVLGHVNSEKPLAWMDVRFVLV